MKDSKDLLLAWDLFCKGVPVSSIAQHVGKHRDTIYTWISDIKKSGLVNYSSMYLNSKKGTRKKRINEKIQVLIHSLRAQNSYSGSMIRKIIKDKYNITVSISYVYQILNDVSIKSSK